MGIRMLMIATFLAALAGTVKADVAKGVWRTEPDDKGQVGLVHVQACGAALCGVIRKAYDAKGREVRTKNVGKTILFDMTETGRGAYEGRILIPKFNRSLRGTMQVQGKRMVLSGCLVGICGKQVWTQVRYVWTP